MTDSITVEELDELDLRYAQAGRLDIGKPNLWPRVSRAARRGLTAWRPIETAPKDVGDYLVWVGEAIFAHQCRDGKWWEDGSRIKPTHWLPLPPTPTDDGVTDAYPYTIPGHPGPEYFAGLPEKYQNNTLPIAAQPGGEECPYCRASLTTDPSIEDVMYDLRTSGEGKKNKKPKPDATWRMTDDPGEVLEIYGWPLQEKDDGDKGADSDRNDSANSGAAVCSNPDCARYLSAAQEAIGELETEIEILKEVRLALPGREELLTDTQLAQRIERDLTNWSPSPRVAPRPGGEELRETQAKLAETIHALEHIISCDTGTALCADCLHLAKAAVAGKHWVHFVDDAPSPQGDGGYWRPRYRVIDEHAQIIAVTRTKWTAEKLIEGIKADGGLTSKLGSWSIVAEAKE
jgi:hypothetical protein